MKATPLSYNLSSTLLRKRPMDRRTFIALMSSISLSTFTLSRAGASEKKIDKPIPSSGELVPVIGMGTWITFNVGDSQRLRDNRNEVLKRFFELGGGMVDSSPMYGSARSVVGEGLSLIHI